MNFQDKDLNKKTIAQVKLEFMQSDLSDIPKILENYKSDDRRGIINICKQYKAKIDAYQKEIKRTESMKHYERIYSDYTYICGIDEVGRGPLAGPVVACALILPKDCDILYINDSKKLSKKTREELYDEILESAVSYGIGSIHSSRIDEINILQATFEAMRDAIYKLKYEPDILLNDAVTIPNISIRQIPIVKGDSKSISIAAASILAKVTRDRLMVAYDKVFPGYGFADNKGYGSASHIEAIKRLGPCPIHRRSFIKNIYKED